MVYLIREATFAIILLRAAYKADRNLLVGRNHSVERLSGEDAVSKFLTDLGWRSKRILFVFIVLVEVTKALKEAELEGDRLRTIVDEVCRILAALAHVECSEIKRALHATTLVENDRKLLLNASSRYLDQVLVILVVINDNHKVLRDDIRLGSSHANANADDLVRLNLELFGLDRDPRLAADLLAERDVTTDAALVLELKEL